MQYLIRTVAEDGMVHGHSLKPPGLYPQIYGAQWADEHFRAGTYRASVVEVVGELDVGQACHTAPEDFSAGMAIATTSQMTTQLAQQAHRFIEARGPIRRCSQAGNWNMIVMMSTSLRRYDKSTGKLHYTLSSSLRDRNRRPDFSSRHKVTVLGLKPVAGGGTPNERVPDLVPFSPLGTDPGAFCRTEQDGKVLKVSVKNQGNKNAAASRATVLFSNGPVTVDTPPVSAGGSLDLLFQSPPDCFRLGCSFKITVDSNNQVDESENEGNNSANGDCIVIR